MIVSTPLITHSTLVVSCAGACRRAAQVAAVADGREDDGRYREHEAAGGGTWPSRAAVRLSRQACEQLVAAHHSEDRCRVPIRDRSQLPQRIDRVTSTHALALR